MIPRRSWKPNGRILVTGTIFNPNWYLSHITPLVRSGLKEVILVIDEPQQLMDGVRFACPPKWLAKLGSRSVAKAIWTISVGFRCRPDLFMGYNLVAGGCTALVAGAILGRPTCYQMTGGQLVLSTLNVETFEFEKASKLEKRVLKAIERLAISVVRKFDFIVVRGSKGKAFLAGYGIEKNVIVITGSVKTIQLPTPDREIDLVFLGRLNPIKQVDQFIQIVSEISHVVPFVRAVIVGDGALMEELKAYADRLGVSGHIEFLGKIKDVERILACSKVFILTSKSEGLSIAMVEAMASGAVPVVADVGELRDLVHDGVNGYIIEPNNIKEYVDKVVLLLQHKILWHKLSSHAIETAIKSSSTEVIGDMWRQSIHQVVGRASDCAMNPVAGDQLS